MSRGTRLFLLCCACLGLVLLMPSLGMTVISPFSLVPGSPDAEVYWRLRVPRVAAAFVAGAGLSVGGMVFQAMFRNPLATPFTLGVASGASFGASLAVVLGLGLGFAASLGIFGAALVGGFLSIALVYGITRARGGFSTPVMLLAGVIVNFTFSSLVLFIQYLAGMQDSQRILHWLMGSLSGLAPTSIVDLAFVVFACCLAIYRQHFALDLLLAGEALAASRGLAVGRAKLALFVLASLMVCCIVSLAGTIGFVGMMMPHLCRLVFGWTHKLLVPASLVMGGTFLVLCDVLARVVLAPAELPIGIVTAMIGGPFFLWVLFRSQNNGEHF